MNVAEPLVFLYVSKMDRTHKNDYTWAKSWGSLIETCYLINTNVQQLLILLFYYRLDQNSARSHNNRYSMQTTSNYNFSSSDDTESSHDPTEKFSLWNSSGNNTENNDSQLRADVTNTSPISSNAPSPDFTANTIQPGASIISSLHGHGTKQLLQRTHSDPALKQERSSVLDHVQRANKITTNVLFKGMRDYDFVQPRKQENKRNRSNTATGSLLRPILVRHSDPSPQFKRQLQVQIYPCSDDSKLNPHHLPFSPASPREHTNSTINDAEQSDEEQNIGSLFDDDQRQTMVAKIIEDDWMPAMDVKD